MLTDDQVIERLRRALESEAAGIDPPVGLHDRIHRELLTTGSRRRWRKPAIRLRLPNAGGVLTALASLSAVAIAVVAIATLGHSRSNPGAGARGPADVGALTAKLAVLRRPQTAADRLPAVVARALRLPRRWKIIAKLTRLATTVDAGSRGAVRVYVIVFKPFLGTGLPGGPAIPRPGDEVSSGAVWAAGGGKHATSRGGLGALAVPPGVGVQTGGSGAAIVGSPGYVRRVGGVDMSVIPDGATRVDWIFTITDFRGSAPGQSALVHPRIEGNVAVATVRPHEGYLSSATWYGANGRVIASFSDNAQVMRQQVADARAMGRRSRPIPSSLSRHFSVFRSPLPPPAVRKSLPFGLAASTVQNSGFGLNIDQARFVPYPGAPSWAGAPPGIWLIPGTSGVNLIDGPAGIGRPLSIVNAGGLVLTAASANGTASVPGLHPGGQTIGQTTASVGGLSVGGLHPGGKSSAAPASPGTETVGGLVPDGNPTVTVKLAGGAVRTVPVIDNVYSITVKGHVVAVIAKNAAGGKVIFRG